MSHNNNISRNKVYDRLPVHRPDEDLWNRINSRLDEGAADSYRQALTELPVHKAPAGVWTGIEKHLSRTRLKLAMIWLGIATAASLAVFTVLNSPFTSIRQPRDISAPVASGNHKNSSDSQKEAVAENITEPSANLSVTTVGSGLTSRTAGNVPVIELQSVTRTFSPANARQALITSTRQALIEVAYKPGLTKITSKKRVPVSIPVEQIAQTSLAANSNGDKEPSQVNRTKLALALAYTPESIDNGYNPTVIHNVGMTASIDLDNFRVRSSLGMAYNSEHLNYSVKATQHLDNYNNGSVSNVEELVTDSQFEGTERHGFVSWDIGGGRKLFATRNLTTWFNAGAGLAVRVNNASLRDATIETLKNSYNATVNSIDIEAPAFNRINMSLASGIEFDYRLLKRLSFTLQPQARYYIYPVFTSAGNSPNPFSLGLLTGMKFDL